MIAHQTTANGEQLIVAGQQVLVASHSNPGVWYALNWAGGWRCDCPGFEHRGHCRHQDALRAYLKQATPATNDDTESGLLDDDGPPARRLALVAGGAPRVDDGEYVSFQEWKERKSERHEEDF